MSKNSKSKERSEETPYERRVEEAEEMLAVITRLQMQGVWKEMWPLLGLGAILVVIMIIVAIIGAPV